MGTRRFIPVMIVSAWASCLLAQQAPPPPPTEVTPPAASETSAPVPPDTQDDPPLTPAQQREQQIRVFDPLDRSDEQDNAAREKADRDAANRRDAAAAAAALPGSIAATERDLAGRTGPRVRSDDPSDPSLQEYNGPAVLSRSYSVNRPIIPTQVKWAESVGVSSVYDTGLVKATAGEGTLNSGSLVGSQLTWSLSGRHYFRRDQIGVRYAGDMSFYSGSSAFSGANNNILVDYTHIFTRRLSVNLTGTGSILSQNFVLSNADPGPDSSIASINLGSSPNIQITDDGIKQYSVQADVTWQKSARLSFSAGTTDFSVIRDAPGLLGMNGQQARGDMNYRLTRTMTVGSYYSYSYYAYPHGSGTSDVSTFGAIYSYAFTRSMQLRFRGGVSNVETLGFQTVSIASVYAALLGQSAGIIDAYSKAETSDLSAQLVKDFRGGKTASVAFAHGVSPGNGVFQTATQESITAGFTMRLFRDYTLQTSFGRDTLTSVAQALGKYQSDYGRIAFSRKINRSVTLNFAAEFRHFEVADLISVRNQLRITSGLSWGSQNGRLWPF